MNIFLFKFRIVPCLPDFQYGHRESRLYDLQKKIGQAILIPPARAPTCHSEFQSEADLSLLHARVLYLTEIS